MGQIFLTADMMAKLAGITERQELRDETGKLIGYFDPPPAIPPNTGAWGPFTEEQVERAMRREGPYFTLDEIAKKVGMS